MTEFRIKQSRIQELLCAHQLQAVLLQRSSSFAWATCGAASYVNTASTTGAASLLITPDKHYLLTTNIEATRLEQEEKLHYQGWDFQIYPWHKKNDLVEKLIGSAKLGADFPIPGALDLSPEISRLRCALLPEENIRFRVLARLCAESMYAAILNIKPGMSEHQAASLLAEQTLSRGVQAIVNLVAADERIYRFRHPLPTFNDIDKYLILVLVGRRWGLTCSISRLVYFGKLPDELRQKSQEVAFIDASFIDATRPGTAMYQAFNAGLAAYTQQGYAAEWRNHHQGGPTAYETREFLVNETTMDLVQSGMVFAWNPSISGYKSEDSIEVGPESNEVLTQILEWPVIEVEIGDRVYARPAILEVD